MSASSLSQRLTTTVAKELLVGITGIVLVLFIIGHLAGNLLIFVGPEAFNLYAEKLADLGPLLWVARIGLIVAAVAHIYTAIRLARMNRIARPDRYAHTAYLGRKSMATRTMIFSGVFILFFLFLHLYDFTFADKVGPGSVVAGENLGLYGLVWNTFANPIHALIYIIAVSAVGLHLSHAISSVVSTLGILTEKATDKVDFAGKLIGLAIALGFAAIPIFVLVHTYIIGVEA